jgi:hypothetical protein
VIPDPERASVRRGLVGGPRSPVPVREMSTIWPLETGGGLRSEPLRPIAPIQFGTEVRPLDSPDTLSQHVCPCRQAARTFVLCCLHRQPPVRARRLEVCKLQATSTASEATQGLGSSTMSEVTQAGWIRVEDGAPRGVRLPPTATGLELKPGYTGSQWRISEDRLRATRVKRGYPC